MEPIVEEFTITLKYQVKVDTETGEMTTKCISRKVDKSEFEVTEVKKSKSTKSKVPQSTEPLLTLESNKYSLTQAAVDLMELGPDCKLDIKYEKRDKGYIPIIGSDESFGTKGGNKLTKSLTVACRGSKNEELSKYGTEFLVIPHETKVGIFILQSKDSNISLEETNEELPEEIAELDDLQTLIDDADVTEIEPSIFKL